MAYKYREEIVGKRFLSVSGFAKLKLGRIPDWGWRTGVIRAASHKDNKHKDLQVNSYFYFAHILVYHPYGQWQPSKIGKIKCASGTNKHIQIINTFRCLFVVCGFHSWCLFSPVINLIVEIIFSCLPRRTIQVYQKYFDSCCIDILWNVKKYLYINIKYLIINPKKHSEIIWRFSQNNNSVCLTTDFFLESNVRSTFSVPNIVFK